MKRWMDRNREGGEKGEFTLLHRFLSLQSLCRFGMHCLSSLLPSPVILNLFISRMDKRLVLSILALCVMNVVSETSISQHLTPSNSTPANSSTPAPTTSCVCNISTACASPTQPESPPPALGVFKVKWKESCQGDVRLSLLSPRSLPLCFNSRDHLNLTLGVLCERKGCEGSPMWTEIPASSTGYQLSGDGRVTKNSCTTLRIQCEVVPDQLVGYKVVTGLLCVLVLVVLMCQTRDRVVSYHRGKAGLQLNDNTDKRHSYPGLERLTVNNSREPSSNRNSDYDSYNV
ncbi:unnamed protein product [Coregonus sp. 'balchen']|nr:unnamed protein product [Coregonus sp. 'balchen']